MFARFLLLLVLTFCCSFLQFGALAQELEKQLLENVLEFIEIDNGYDENHRDLASSKSNESVFNITFGYVSDATAGEKAAFTAARLKWRSVITSAHPTRTCVKAGQSLCGFKFTSGTCIDDLFIAVRIYPIDGPGGV